MKNVKLGRLFFAVPLVILVSIYILPVSALPSTGSFSATDPSGDVYTTYCTDDGYFPMRDITALNITWNATTLTISLQVATLTNTTAAWNNTGFTITIGNGTDGQEWLPQWSSTHFNTTVASTGQWLYCVLVQNVTAEGGLSYSYVVDTSWTYTTFASLGVTVEIPTTPANTIIVNVPWTAIGGIGIYGDEFYVSAGSFYCYAYGEASTGDMLTKFLDHISPTNDKVVIVRSEWGYDPEGYPKYEVLLVDYNIIPEISSLWLLLGAFVVASILVLATKKLKPR